MFFLLVNLMGYCLPKENSSPVLSRARALGIVPLLLSIISLCQILVDTKSFRLGMFLVAIRTSARTALGDKAISAPSRLCVSRAPNTRIEYARARRRA